MENCVEYVEILDRGAAVSPDELTMSVRHSCETLIQRHSVGIAGHQNLEVRAEDDLRILVSVWMYV